MQQLSVRGAHNLTPGTDLAHISLRARALLVYISLVKHLGLVYAYNTGLIPLKVLFMQASETKEGAL
jgi:hypothetical protein